MILPINSGNYSQTNTKFGNNYDSVKNKLKKLAQDRLMHFEDLTRLGNTKLGPEPVFVRNPKVSFVRDFLTHSKNIIVWSFKSYFEKF